MYFSMSRLTKLDVKWADLFNANSRSFHNHHYNPFHQLIIAVDGPVRIETAQGRYTLRTGESLLLLPWEQHTGWNQDEQQGSFFWTQFSCYPGIAEFDVSQAPDIKIVHAEKTELRTSTYGHDDLLIIPKLHLSNQRFQLLHLFEQLVSNSNNPKGYFRFHQTLLLGEILRLIASDFFENSSRDSLFPVSYMTYRKLVNYLNNFYEKEIQKEELEKTMDRTYEYMCHVFKKYSGTTVVQYVNQLRIQRAKYLLLSTDKKIGAIAAEVGFEDAFYFSRIFKRLEGISPQYYRMKKN